MSSVDYLAEAASIEAQIIADRRHLHANPELGFDCPKTAAYIKRRLDEMGVRHVDCGVIDDITNDNYEIAGFGRTQTVTGVVALIGHGDPCFLLRADMDALPLQEFNDDIDFKSRVDGRMHACGHDSHVAMLLGAAQLLKNHEAQLYGTVKLMFQTGEEWGCGAKLMIDDGLLQNPTVSAAFGLHVNPSEDLGRINVHPGMAAATTGSNASGVRSVIQVSIDSRPIRRSWPGGGGTYRAACTGRAPGSAVARRPTTTCSVRILPGFRCPDRVPVTSAPCRCSSRPTVSGRPSASQA